MQRIVAVYDQRRTIGHVTMPPSPFQAGNAVHLVESCLPAIWNRAPLDDTILDVIATEGGRWIWKPSQCG